MKILIADDNNTDRLILQKILEKSGHQVEAGINGKEAVELFKSYKPDIVLLDALMPVMDGYEAAKLIKESAGDNLTPIIFLTSLQEATALARCLEVGGDDFLTKPYNKIILGAKLKAFERMKVLYDEVREQRNEIQLYSDHMLHEQEAAKSVFDNIAHRGNLEHPNIKYLLSPMSVFNGDLLLCAKSPSGSINLMLGDFTGHGLPAAIGAMPVADIFYGMTMKGFTIIDIITEINNRLNKILPIGVFCCATFCEINYQDKVLTLWSGGLPDAYITRPNVGLIKTISSTHLPLGVLGPNSFRSKIEIVQFETGDSLYVFSDGIMEAEAPDGSMFGEDRVLEQINSKCENGIYDPLIKSVWDFTQSTAQTDDLTFIEFTFDPIVDSDESESSGTTEDIKPLDWRIEYEFRPETLKKFDPLPLISQILIECPGLNPYRSRIFTILAELYSNALDHGVLGLDSSLKKSAKGFTEYYKQRKNKLNELTEGYVILRMEHTPTKTGGDLIIEVEDTGKGFDISKDTHSGNDLSGRGMKLIRSLCKSLEYSKKGTSVKAVFQWHYN